MAGASLQDYSSDSEDDEIGPTSGFQLPPGEGSHFVVAIDIGTCYSGYAFSLSSDKYAIFAMHPSDPYRSEGSPITTKVPTTLLLRPNGSFHSFGHQAFKHYNRELDEDEQKQWYYFERFKMKLHTEKRLSRQTSVAAANGKALPIRTVFAHALRYFKSTAEKQCEIQTEEALNPGDFEWVVTVPAIWDGGAKQTMREAAYEAGLASERKPDRVQIALEPESASLYCKSLKRIGKSPSDTESLVSKAFMLGSTYLLADLGGGTADVTVHEVTSAGVMKELYHATGGAWGGSYVDGRFVELVESIFGKETIQAYKEEYPGDWVEFVSVKFETNKRTASQDSTTYVEFPFSFNEFLQERGSSAKESIAAMKNPNLKFSRGALAMKYPEVVNLFMPVLNNISQHLKSIISEIKKIDYVLLVGGFATCELLQTHLQKEMEKQFELRIIIPPNSSLAVVMGAVLFGHDPAEIVSRRVRYSYGIECQRSNLGLKGCFQTFLKKNKEVDIDEVATHDFRPVHENQTVAAIRVHESDKEETEMVSEDGVRKVATFDLPMPNTHLGLNRKLLVSMKFGLTEIKVHSVDKSSGKTVKGSVKLDFLASKIN